MSIRFGPFDIGPTNPVLVIAEIGVNHNGSVELGLRQLRAAATAGARAVKFQSFSADELASEASPLAEYQRGASTGSQNAMLKQLEMPIEHLEQYQRAGRELGVTVFSTPFDARNVAELQRAKVPLMKLGSGEITNVELISAVAKTALPTIMSTGMSDIDEVARAVEVYTSNGGGPLVLLHCVSSYPARLQDMNLRVIATLRDHFRVPVGLSDHSIGIEAAMLAVAMDAVIIEKHFTVDRALPGPDHSMSTEPSDFRALVEGVERARQAAGSGSKVPVAAEEENRRLSRRSLVAADAIPAGTVLTRELVAAKRPAGGLDPWKIGSIVGRRVNRTLAANDMISLTDLD